MPMSSSAFHAHCVGLRMVLRSIRRNSRWGTSVFAFGLSFLVISGIMTGAQISESFPLANTTVDAIPIFRLPGVFALVRVVQIIMKVKRRKIE